MRGLNLISSKILKKEIKIGKVISVKSLEDLLEDFVDLEGVNIKIEFIDKVDR